MQSGHSQWYSPPRPLLPPELVLEVAQYLGLMDIVSRLGTVCKDWRRAVSGFEGRCHKYFSSFCSGRFAVADVVALAKLADQRYKEVLEKLELTTIAAVKRFCKVTRFYIELSNTDIPTYRILRLKHTSRHGELSISAGALAALCQRSQMSLQELQLQNCPNWDLPLVSAIAGCTSLHTLNLSYSGANDEVIEALSRLKAGIKRLVLKGLDRLTSKSVNLLGELRGVRELDLSLSFPNLQLPNLHPLCSLSLTHLLIEGLSIDPRDFPSICQLTSLRVLSLRKVAGLKPLAFMQLRKSLKFLEKLNIKECFQLSEATLHETVTNYWPHLQVLAGADLPTELQDLLSQRFLHN